MPDWVLEKWQRVAPIAASMETTQRVYLARLCFALAFAWLFFAVFVICRAPGTGNSYATFGTLWASGDAANQGLNPYADYPATLHFGAVPDLNLNPPWTIGVFRALAYLPIERFKQVWTLLTGACLLIGCLILIAQQPRLQGRQVLWVLLSIPTIETLREGQVYAWPFLFGVIAWMLDRKGRTIAAGIALGLIVALRPTMGFVPLILFLSGHRKTAAASVATILTLYLLPLLAYGPSIYVEWLHALFGERHEAPANIALAPTFARYGYWDLGVVVAILTALLVCGWAFRHKPDFTIASGTAFCLGILCSPLAWFHYILFAAPFFMARRWSMLTTAGASLLLICFQFSAATQGLLSLVSAVMMLAFFIRERRTIDFL